MIAGDSRSLVGYEYGIPLGSERQFVFCKEQPHERPRKSNARRGLHGLRSGELHLNDTKMAGLQQLQDFRHGRSEEHTSEIQSPIYFGCRLLLEKKKKRERYRVGPAGRGRALTRLSHLIRR